VYPWGENPNNRYRMYWKDSTNVLNDLDQFKALYIKVHGCVWSEYGLGDNYDDDGENHDGDENWYMTRVQPFRANVAFSLYGILKEDSFYLGRRCGRGTFINSFFTYEGADAILQGLGKSFTNVLTDDDNWKNNNGDDDAYNNPGVGCYESDDDEIVYVENNDDYNDNENEEEEEADRRLSGSGDNYGYSKTLGCSADGDFAIAKFLGDECDGRYFLNTTKDDMTSYNDAMNSVSCHKIWKNNHDDTLVQQILSTSFACDLSLYGSKCPDPYKLKHKYDANIKLSSKMGRSTVIGRWQTPMRIMTVIFTVIGMILLCSLGFVKNPKLYRKFRQLTNRKRKGGDGTADPSDAEDGIVKEKKSSKKKKKKSSRS